MTVAPTSTATAPAPAKGTAPPSLSSARSPAPIQSFAETLDNQGVADTAPPALAPPVAVGPCLPPAALGATGARGATLPPGGGPLDVDVKPKRDPRHDDDPLDPLTRHAAQLAPPMLSPAVAAPPPAGAPPPAARLSLEEVLPALVRRVAWSGDGRRATMRLELGTGELKGATLLIHAEQGRVQVELSAPAGVDKVAWRERLMARLQGRGVPVDSLQVD